MVVQVDAGGWALCKLVGCEICSGDTALSHKWQGSAYVPVVKAPARLQDKVDPTGMQPSTLHMSPGVKRRANDKRFYFREKMGAFLLIQGRWAEYRPPCAKSIYLFTQNGWF